MEASTVFTEAMKEVVSICPRLSAIWLSVPRTGSRHLDDILHREYKDLSPFLPHRGALRCTNASWMHSRPVYIPAFLGTFADSYPPPATPGFTAMTCSRDAFNTAARWQWVLGAAISRGVKLITMVRRPLDWMLSYWSLTHNRSEDNVTKHAAFAAFAASPLATNFQLAFLVGKRLPLQFISARGPQCEYFPRLALPRATEDDLHRVGNWLKAGSLLAGTTEDFETTVRMYAARLRWRNFFPYKEKSFAPRLEVPGMTRSSASQVRNGDITRDPLTIAMLAPGLAVHLSRPDSLDAQLYAAVQASLAPWFGRTQGADV